MILKKKTKEKRYEIIIFPQDLLYKKISQKKKEKIKDRKLFYV